MRRRPIRRMLRPVVTWSMIWVVLLAAAAAILAVLVTPLSNRFRLWLCAVDADLVAQIVPAVVVAIFVFAVGTAFVVAQVVPGARGTRAVGILRGRRLNSTISPTPALLVGAAYVATDSPGKQAVAAAALAGVLIYTYTSLLALLSVLIDATDPSQFKLTLLEKARAATSGLSESLPRTSPLAVGDARPAHFVGLHDPRRPSRRPQFPKVGRRTTRRTILGRPLPASAHRTRPDKAGTSAAPAGVAGGSERHDSGLAKEQAAADDLYDVVRTVRGWVRVAARTNDSRELQESLEALLALVDSHAKLVATRGLRMRTVPSTYWEHADAGERLLNPLSGGSDHAADGSSDSSWDPWAPPKLVARSVGGARHRAIRLVPGPSVPSPPTSLERSRLHDEFFALPSTWFANEAGRAVVRAVEIGLGAGALLDRDTLRLLNTLQNAALIFAKAGAPSRRPAEDPRYWSLEWGAGIMIRYLTEIGLGVLHVSADRSEWYLEPCICLADLSREFASLEADSSAPSLRRLTTGAAAGCLIVADMILYAQQTADPDAGVDRGNGAVSPTAEPSTRGATTEASTTSADGRGASQADFISASLRAQVRKLTTDDEARRRVHALVMARKFVPGERRAGLPSPSEARLSAVGWNGEEQPVGKPSQTVEVPPAARGVLRLMRCFGWPPQVLGSPAADPPR